MAKYTHINVRNHLNQFYTFTTLHIHLCLSIFFIYNHLLIILLHFMLLQKITKKWSSRKKNDIGFRDGILRILKHQY